MPPFPLLVKGTLLAARFSGWVRQRSLNRLAAKDLNAKAKEILFLMDLVYQLQMQVSILQKHLNRKGQNPRYSAGQQRLYTPGCLIPLPLNPAFKYLMV